MRCVKGFISQLYINSGAPPFKNYLPVAIALRRSQILLWRIVTEFSKKLRQLRTHWALESLVVIDVCAKYMRNQTKNARSLSEIERQKICTTIYTFGPAALIAFISNES
jgi:hypothetical protein